MSQAFDVTEWITCGEGDGIEDIILLLRLHHTYEAPFNNSKEDSSRTPRKRITKVDSASTSSQASDNTGDVNMDASQVPERQIGDKYPPNRLPDHQGPYYAHVNAKLPQRDYRDVDGSLIAPFEVYEKLTEGTLVLVMVTLATYTIPGEQTDKGEVKPDKKIYHVLVDRLKILDRGDGEAWSPPVPVMPERRYSPTTPGKRGRDDAADTAFESFGSKMSPSPIKKAKRTTGKAV
ncbi:hypothetical protein B0H13DRAFT_2344040 [Mycena leptocephala]|nr:hypothetical protein B0H13DRAFT_2344040 [Mycena leptocephala]